MISTYGILVANHLWQSTLFAAGVWFLCLALRSNRAALRHRLWLAASIKFLIPFSLLVNAGSHIPWRPASVSGPLQISIVVEMIGRPFATSSPSLVPVRVPVTTQITPQPANRIPVILVFVWTLGFVASVCWWLAGWYQLRKTVRRATPLNLDIPLRVMSCSERVEPGVFGIFRPVLLLPDGITERLTPEQLQCVIAHELGHVRRRDNLAAAIHMFVEALFWFHPLVWWIRVRIIDEQERACDEGVIRLGGDPHIYAQSILKICEFYLTSPVICVSCITGSNLRRRIGNIMKGCVGIRLGFSRTALLTVAAIAALAGPIAIGAVHRPVKGTQPPPHPSPSPISTEAAMPVVMEPKPAPRVPVRNTPPNSTSENAAKELESTLSVLSPSRQSLLTIGMTRYMPTDTRVAEPARRRRQDSRAEQALRRLIDELWHAAPQFDQMVPELAEAVYPLLPEFYSAGQQFGALRAVSYAGVGPTGSDVYDVWFAKGKARFSILLTADGKTEKLAFRPLEVLW